MGTKHFVIKVVWKQGKKVGKYVDNWGWEKVAIKSSLTPTTHLSTRLPNVVNSTECKLKDLKDVLKCTELMVTILKLFCVCEVPSQVFCFV